MPSHITVAYLVTDESFIAACLQKNQEAILFWQQQEADHPGQEAMFREAKQLVLAMYHHGLNREIAEGQQLLRRMMHADEVPEPAEKKGVRPLLWRRVAAALIIMICTGLAFFWFLPGREVKYVTIHTGTGELKQVILPDHSTVWLNAGTTLRYADNFASGREVVLEDGEAFFEVVHQLENPFVVLTGTKLRIEDLGTAFSVKSYNGLEEEHVGVVSGKVAVQRVAQQVTLLKAGEGVIANTKTGAMKVSPYAANSAAWMKGNTVLNDVSFRELQLVLQKIYDVQLVFDTPALANCRITTTFRKSDPVRNILEDLRIVYGIAYTKRDNVIHLSGNSCQ